MSTFSCSYAREQQPELHHELLTLRLREAPPVPPQHEPRHGLEVEALVRESFDPIATLLIVERRVLQDGDHLVDGLADDLLGPRGLGRHPARSQDPPQPKRPQTSTCSAHRSSSSSGK
jgi:hypothetical protein